MKSAVLWLFAVICSTTVVFAQATQAAPDVPPSPMDQMIHMVGLLAVTVGIVYFMIIRPQQKKQKETEAMRA